MPRITKSLRTKATLSKRSSQQLQFLISKMPSTLRKSHYRTIQKFNIDYSTETVTQYESERTGMRVVVVDVKGPKVLGFFALATEIHDDSGAPHTLEHLCFMGSKSYQYKGLLDKLATRAYSNTNAWTATDHTAYTLETAGWAGFAQILPVYLEHVIVPTLTDAACYTEVHHVDGTGHDAGVVYSEMQGVQNTQGELMTLVSKRLMYPEGVGFRYETGGMMEQLRVLTADRIREFHREMYQPKNLCLVILGEVDHKNMIDILDDFEETILQDIPKPGAPFKRPWVDSKQAVPLAKSIIETVEFPEEDESSGEVMISFFGPPCTDPLQMGAMDVLLTYLAGSSASVLENILVEREQITSGVYYSRDNRPNAVIQFNLSSVDSNKLAEVEARFFEVLRDTVKNSLDMVYVLECVLRQRRQIKFSAESNGPSTDMIISDFLFGSRDGSTLKTLGTLQEYDELEKWTEGQWKQFLKMWLVEAPHISILGKPSLKLSKKLKTEEKRRVAEQKKRLGESGLKELEKKLEAAKAENDKEIPRELLEKFKVPDTSSIHFISTTTARSGEARKMGKLDNPIQRIVDQDKSQLPLFIHFEHVTSNFAHINLIIGTQTIPVHLRPLLPIYIDNFFNAPILRNGERIEFEQVVMELEKDTVGYTMDSNAFGNSEMMRIVFQVEAEKYETAIRWIKELFTDNIFELERIESANAKLLADIPEAKRSGNSMTWGTETMVHASKESIGRARATLTKALYLKRVKGLLEAEPDTVISQLKEIRDALFQLPNFRVLVIANIGKIKKPVSSWELLAKDLDLEKPLLPLDKKLDRLSESGKNPGNQSYIIPLPTIDSSYLLSVAKGPKSQKDPEYPALMVAVAYIDAVEGPLWTAVRGTGLAYGTYFSRNIESGQITFDIYRSPDAFKAFAMSQKTIEGFVSGATPFEATALEGAISSIILGLASGQANIVNAAQASFMRQVMQDLPKDWNDVILKRVRDVTVEEIKQVMEDILLPVFRPKMADVFITCAPIMEENILSEFKRIGFAPEVKPLTYFQDDYGLKAVDGVEGIDDDDDEGEEGDVEVDGEEGESEEVDEE